MAKKYEFIRRSVCESGVFVEAKRATITHAQMFSISLEIQKRVKEHTFRFKTQTKEKKPISSLEQFSLTASIFSHTKTKKKVLSSFSTVEQLINLTEKTSKTS